MQHVQSNLPRIGYMFVLVICVTIPRSYNRRVNIKVLNILYVYIMQSALVSGQVLKVKYHDHAK